MTLETRFKEAVKAHLDDRYPQSVRDAKPWPRELSDYLILQAFPGVWYEDIYHRCPAWWLARVYLCHVENMRIQNARAEKYAKGRREAASSEANLQPGEELEGHEWVAIDDWAPDQFGQHWDSDLAARAKAEADAAIARGEW